jgi:hypothetical protein
MVLPDDLRDIGVPGHHPEWIKTLRFDQAERLVGAKPPKPGKKRFLLRIGFRRGDQASEAVGYFFSLRHSASISHSGDVDPARMLPHASIWMRTYRSASIFATH